MDERSRLLEQAQRCRRIAEKISDTVDYAGFLGRDPGGKNIYVTMGDSGQGLYPWRCGRNAEHGPQFGIVLGLPMSWVDVRCLRATDQRSGHPAAGQGWRDPVVRPFLHLRLGR